MYKVVKSTMYPLFERTIVGTFDNEKEALVCKIENNWKCMAKYIRDKKNEEFVFEWGELHSVFIGTPPSYSNPIPIPNEVLMTYNIEKLDYIANSQSNYFEEGSSVCYIKK